MCTFATSEMFVYPISTINYFYQNSLRRIDNKKWVMCCWNLLTKELSSGLRIGEGRWLIGKDRNDSSVSAGTHVEISWTMIIHILYVCYLRGITWNCFQRRSRIISPRRLLSNPATWVLMLDWASLLTARFINLKVSRFILASTLFLLKFKLLKRQDSYLVLFCLWWWMKMIHSIVLYVLFWVLNEY